MHDLESDGCSRRNVLILDGRSIARNPYHVPALKELTGLDSSVSDFVMEDETAQAQLETAVAHVRFAIDRNEPDVLVMCGCQGGRHRSVAIIARLGEVFTAQAPTTRHIELGSDASAAPSTSGPCKPSSAAEVAADVAGVATDSFRPLLAVSPARAPTAVAGRKAVTSALCIIPPGNAWPAIQAVRAARDKAFARWPPHINLLYPFVPEEVLPAAAALAAAALAAVAPPRVALRAVGQFGGGRGGGGGGLAAMHAALARVFPHCDDWAAHGGQYAPHLSLAQSGGRGGRGGRGGAGRRPGGDAREAAAGSLSPAAEVEAALAAAGWSGAEFDVTHVFMIARYCCC
jgi:hypothetical protein